MIRAAWCTDIHLDFLDDEGVERFLRSVDDRSADVVLLGGDISTANRIASDLERMASLIDAPILFVLGNHDFYHGSIRDVRGVVARLCEGSRRLHWLNQAGVYSLSKTTAVVGHDGWGDGREGNGLTSPVELNDFYLIEELAGRAREDLISRLHDLGEEAAGHFRTVLPEALSSHRDVVVLTHVPPFREATWYDGEVSKEDWLPFFCGRAAGDALKEVMSRHPRNQLTVLCGHTHGGGEATILPNLRVLTGGARYRTPQVQSVLELD